MKGLTIGTVTCVLWLCVLPAAPVSGSCVAADVLAARELSEAVSSIPRIPVPLTDQPLSFIHVGGCLRQDAGWWSYEFCPGKHLRQYHKEQETVASEYFLGFGPNALDSDEISLQQIRYQDRSASMKDQIIRAGLESSVDDAKRSSNTRAHCRKTADGKPIATQVVVQYGGGTVCDVTKKPRRVAVIYVCDRNQPQITWNITESVCVYTVFVVGRMSCNMMGIAGVADSRNPPPQPAKHGAASNNRPTDVRRHPSARKLMDLANEVPPTITPISEQPPSQPQPPAVDESPPVEVVEVVAREEPHDHALVRDESGQPLSFDDMAVFSCV